MSKITFRADDELIEELEAFDISKSEVMRRALREYLESHPKANVNATETSNSSDLLDDLVAERIDAMIETRLNESEPQLPAGNDARRSQPQDINVNVTLDGESVATDAQTDKPRKTAAPEPSDTPESERTTCGQCGENVDSEHVYCPNCGEKVTRRVFCDCGDELRSDWAFCPSCGRRTPAADVLEST